MSDVVLPDNNLTSDAAPAVVKLLVRGARYTLHVVRAVEPLLRIVGILFRSAAAGCREALTEVGPELGKLTKTGNS